MDERRHRFHARGYSSPVRHRAGICWRAPHTVQSNRTTEMETFLLEVQDISVKSAIVSSVLVASAVCLSQSWAQTDLPVFSDSLVEGWENWSWAATEEEKATVHSGAASFAVRAQAWQAAYFHHSALNASQYTELVFWINGGPQGGQKLLVQGVRAGVAQSSTNLPALTAGVWSQFSISLLALGLKGATDFDGFWIQDRSGTVQPPFYLDDIRLVGGVLPPNPTNEATVLVDVQRDRHPISPFIYGVAFASTAQLRELNVPLNRSGGNSETRYNWQLNAHNHAADWYFESLPEESATPGEAADTFVQNTKAAGSEAMLTVPLIGWAPKLGANRGRLASFSVKKYGAQTGTDSQWFPDAGNGLRASDGKPITSNDPNDANVAVDLSFQRSWLEHLTARWGKSGQGGVRWFFLDNEPSIWHSTHRDVHPIGATMAEVRDRYLACAKALKSLDENTLVAGPEEWGWSGYFYSGFDQQAGAANGYRQFPDRTTNGGWEYLPWFLDQARQESERTGKRLLDVFTVHYYPQGGEFGSSTSAAMQERRNRSTRALWDTNYVDESWINDRVMLIPRLKAWVAKYYPGTRVGLTEYNWGAEEHVNGATAQADLLGIFGREGLDLANRWTTPPAGSPAFNAIRMYRNYDGTNSAFGETSVRAAGLNPDQLSVFAAERQSDGAITVMLVHKRLDSAAKLRIDLTNAPGTSVANAWQLAGQGKINRLPDVAVQNGTCNLVLPAQSVTLLVFPTQARPRIEARRSGAGLVEVRMSGMVNGAEVIEESADLRSWTSRYTNSVAQSQVQFEVSTDKAGNLFWRSRRAP